ncbi:MAG: PP0621 family protein [Burkholderiaceae bacterium]
MGRILFFIGLALAAYIGWRWMRIKQAGSQSGAPLRRPPPGSPEQMVRCSQCGVHLPRSEALASAGEFYCGEEHRQLGPRA